VDCVCGYSEWIECGQCFSEGHNGSACIDDLCHGGEVPCRIHGDWAAVTCDFCYGDGGWPCGKCDPEALKEWRERHGVAS